MAIIVPDLQTLPSPNARLRMASHISVPAMQSRQHPCRTLRRWFHTARDPPEHRTFCTVGDCKVDHNKYSDKSHRDLSENATGHSHNTCRSRVAFHTHIPIAWQGNKSKHLPSGGICSLVLAKSRTRRSGEKLIEHSDDHGKEHVAGHPLGSDRIQIHARYCTAPS